MLADCQSLSDLGTELSPGLFEIEVNYLVEHEWARSTEDILGCTLMGTYSELVPDTLTGSTLAFTNLLKILKTKNITEWMAVYSNE